MKKSGMTDIVKIVCNIVTGVIVVYGIYIILYGHLSPGGGFPGGVILASALILAILAFGEESPLHQFRYKKSLVWESLGLYIFIIVALLGYLGGSFFFNFLPKGEPFALLSAGSIPLSNIGIGIKVGFSLFAVFLALVLFRLDERDKYL